MRLTIISITTILGLFLCSGAEAQVTLESHFSAKFKPVIDGQLGEWSAKSGGFGGVLRALGIGNHVGGLERSRGDEDNSAKYALAHNEDALNLAISIKDELLVRSQKASITDDHIELWFGVDNPKSQQTEPLGIAFFMDSTNRKEPIEARWLSASERKLGKKIPQIRGALAVHLNSYSVEVQIPWSVLPKGVESRFGLRAAIYVLDNDKENSGLIGTVLGTAPFNTPMPAETMPIMKQSDLTAPLEKFWKDAKVRSAKVSHFSYETNLVGGEAPERLVFSGRHLMAYGGEINSPKTYVSFELPVRRASQIVEKYVQDLTGDGRDEIVIHFMKDVGTSTRSWLSIYQITDDMMLSKIFSAATLVSDSLIKVENKYKFVKGKGQTRAIVFTPSVAQGVDKSVMQEDLPAEGGNPMVVPWDRPPKRKYVFHGGSFIQQYKGMR